MYILTSTSSGSRELSCEGSRRIFYTGGYDIMKTFKVEVTEVYHKKVIVRVPAETKEGALAKVWSHQVPALYTKMEKLDPAFVSQDITGIEEA